MLENLYVSTLNFTSVVWRSVNGNSHITRRILTLLLLCRVPVQGN